MNGSENVLIVGAGPTGLVLAHELTRDGVACRLIDKAAVRSAHSKAIAIHARTLETFQLMQIVDDFLAVGQPIDAIRLFGESDEIGHVDLASTIPSRYPFVLSVPQNQTEQILEDRLAQRGVRVERGTELTHLEPRDGGVVTRLRVDDQEQLAEFDWVMGCDGAHSRVRQALGIGFAGSTYPEHFLLADLRVAGGVDPTEARVWLHRDGVVALFPMPKDRYRLVVADAPSEWTSEPTLRQCQELVEARVPGAPALSDIGWSSMFRIHRREAAQFRQHRCFLLGDAAHIHSPVGGQGMNMGIQDAFNLAWKLSRVIRGVADPILLDSYEAERKPIDEAVIRQTDRATRLVAPHGGAVRFLRDHMMSLLTRLPAVERRIGPALAGIAVDYRNSPIVEERAGGLAEVLAGDRAPDVPLARAEGGSVLQLYDLLAERRPVLLDIGDPSERWPSVPGLHSIPLYHVAPTDSRQGALVDCDGEVAAHFGTAPAAYLIRPDGYVGFHCRRRDVAAALPRYVSRYFSQAV
ncbi:MAG: FAD-dependent monooxygenase [Alphaproteobacteria bacterium]|nr:FAD-dependent monooxygenase [Alphaproteobacteria bacterium]